MFRAVALTAEMVGTGGMWCLSATRVVATLVRCAVVSTFGPGVGRVGKGPIGMALGGRSS